MYKTIADFFADISKQKCPSLSPVVCASKTISDLFENCICKTLPEVIIVKRWHDLLKKYVNDKDTVFLFEDMQAVRIKPKV